MSTGKTVRLGFSRDRRMHHNTPADNKLHQNSVTDPFSTPPPRSSRTSSSTRPGFMYIPRQSILKSMSPLSLMDASSLNKSLQMPRAMSLSSLKLLEIHLSIN